MSLVTSDEILKRIPNVLERGTDATYAVAGSSAGVLAMDRTEAVSVMTTCAIFNLQ